MRRWTRLFSGDRFTPEQKDYDRAATGSSEAKVAAQRNAIQDLDKLCRRCIAFVTKGSYGKAIGPWIQRARELGATDADIMQLQMTVINALTQVDDARIESEPQAIVEVSTIVPMIEEAIKEETPITPEPVAEVVDPEPEKPKMPNQIKVRFEKPKDAYKINLINYESFLKNCPLFKGMPGGPKPDGSILNEWMPKLKKTPFYHNLTLSNVEGLYFPCLDYSFGRNPNPKPDRSQLEVAYSSGGYDGFSSAISNYASTVESFIYGDEPEYNDLGAFTEAGSYASWVDSVSDAITKALEKEGIWCQECFESMEEEVIIGFDVDGGCLIVKLLPGDLDSDRINIKTIDLGEDQQNLMAAVGNLYGGDSRYALDAVFIPGPTFYNRFKPMGRDFYAWDIRLD